MSMNIKSDFDPSDLEKKIKNEATKQIKKNIFNISCPSCSKNIPLKIGTNTCPDCGIEIEFN